MCKDTLELKQMVALIGRDNHFFYLVHQSFIRASSVYFYCFAEKRITPSRTPLRRCSRGLFRTFSPTPGNESSDTGERPVRHRGTKPSPVPGKRALTGKVVKRADELCEGDEITTCLYKGNVNSIVKKMNVTVQYIFIFCILYI